MEIKGNNFSCKGNPQGIESAFGCKQNAKRKPNTLCGGWYTCYDGQEDDRVPSNNEE